MKTICLYHSRDLDGLCSGAIVKRAVPQAELIGYDYGEPLPEIPNGSVVIMIDVSLPMKEMILLARRCHHFKWIDHHASAIGDYNATPDLHDDDKFTAILQNGIAACEIAWRHYFPDQAMPIGVRLLGEYDTWRNSDPNRWSDVMSFQFGMRVKVASPDSFPEPFWQDDSAWVEGVVTQGDMILEYQAQVNEKICKMSFEANFKGLRAICLNAGGFNSDVFKSVWDPEYHDIMLMFQYNGKIKLQTVSLYTLKDIDVSALAKEMGGGGHKKAAGFQCKNIFDHLLK